MKLLYTLIMLLHFATNANSQWMTAQWTPCNSGFGAPLPTINTLAHIGSSIFAGSTSGLFRSDDYGANWTSVNYGATPGVGPALLVYDIFSSDSSIYIGTGDGIFLSTNQGSSWVHLNVGISHYVFSVNKIGNYLLAAGDSGVYRSSDNGLSWQQINNGFSPIPSLVFFMENLLVSGTKIFAIGVGGYVSSDNGNSWTIIPGFDQNSYFDDITKSGSNIIIAGQGKIFVSADDGLTWTQQYVSGTFLGSNFTLFSSNNLIYIGSNKGVNVSTNNGISWFEYPFETQLAFYLSIATALTADSVNVYAGTTHQYNSNINQGILKIPVSQLNKIDKKVSESNLSISPNPFSLQTTITFNLEQTSSTLKIIDLYGNVKRTLMFTGKKLEIDREELSSGIYFFQIIDKNHYISTKKVILE